MSGKRAVRLRGIVVLGWLLATAAFAAPAARHAFVIPAGDAATALRLFARQSGEPVLFPSSLVRGVRTPEVRGEFSQQEALDRLLSGTPVEAVWDARQQVITLRLRPAPPAAPAPADSTSNPSRRRTPDTDETLELAALEVRQTRDAGLISQSILRTDRRAAIYHRTFEREEVEQLGVGSVAELMTLLPGYSGEGMENLQSTDDLAAEPGAVAQRVGAFLKMRGFDSSRTTVLLNGRRVPLDRDARGPDLSRVPTAAIERVEVLPFSGSALYGDNAIGGAVNIVLRKDYVGRSLTTSFGTSTQGGATQYSATLVEGFVFPNGRTRGTAIVDFQHRTPLRSGQRDFLARALQSLPIATVLPEWSPGSNSIPTSRSRQNYVLTALATTPGTVLVSEPLGSGPFRWSDTRYVVPQGDPFVAPTAAQFQPLTASTPLEHRADRIVLLRPATTGSVTAQLEHELLPGGRLEAYAELSASRSRDAFRSPAASDALRLPVSRSPFSTLPVVRQAVVFFDPVDIPDTDQRQTRTGGRVVLGLRGTLPGRWHWTVDTFAERVETASRFDSPSVLFNVYLRNLPLRVADSWLWGLYDPFTDHRRFPIRPESVRDHFGMVRSARTRTDLQAGSARAFGPGWELPAGTLRSSMRVEWQREVTKWSTETQFATPVLERLGLLAAHQASYAPQRGRETLQRAAVVGELSAPLWSPTSPHAGLRRVDADLALRFADAGRGRSRFVPLAALKSDFAGGITLRATYAEGFQQIDEAALAGIQTANTTVALRDPARGGTSSPRVTVDDGGNPALELEVSRARTLGLVVEPPAVEGLMLSLDAWCIEVRNGIRALRPQEILDRPALQHLITRAAPTADDLARGWAGTATAVDARPYNFATVRSEGFDLAVQYALPRTAAGTFTFSARGTIVRRHEEQILGDAEATDRLGLVSDETRRFAAPAPQLPLQGRGAVAWRRDRWRASVSVRHISDYTAQTIRAATNAEDSVFNPVRDTSHVASSTLWDAQASFDWRQRGRESDVLESASFPERQGGAPRLQLTLGVRNLFDRAPPFRADGISFYSQFDDPRMRFVYLRLDREF